MYVQVPYLKCYTDYVNNYNRSMETINSLLTKDKKFSEFIAVAFLSLVALFFVYFKALSCEEAAYYTYVYYHYHPCYI